MLSLMKNEDSRSPDFLDSERWEESTESRPFYTYVTLLVTLRMAVAL